MFNYKNLKQNIENIGRDVAGLILDKLSANDWVNFSMASIGCNNLCNEKYFHTRTLRMYPSTITGKKGKTWRKHVLETEYYIKQLEKKYNHQYNDSQDRNSRLFYKTLSLVNPTSINLFSLALIEACIIGDFELVQYLIERGADVNYKMLALHNTVRLCESETNQLQIFKYLVEKGANIKNNKYLLNFAVINIRLELVKYIVENGGNLQMLDFILHYVKAKECAAILEYLNSLNN